MPRKLKPYKVNEYEHSTGERFDIFLDRNSLDFFATAFEETVRGASEKECRQALIALVEQYLTFEWRKVIVVHSVKDRTFQRDSEYMVSLSFDTHEIAPKSGGGWAERRVVPGIMGGPEREYFSPYHGNTQTNADKGTFVLPHSDELESALTDIRGRIAEMKKALEQLLGEGAERVIAASLASSFAALPSPGDAETETQS